GRFGIKLARANVNGDVTLQFKDLPDDIEVPSVVLREGQSDANVTVAARPGAPLGTRHVRVEAAGAGAQAQGSFKLEVLPAPTPKVDVMFVLDLTESMQFAINGVKSGIADFVAELNRRKVDARFGLVAF